jgi:hypothetical protein
MTALLTHFAVAIASFVFGFVSCAILIAGKNDDDDRERDRLDGYFNERREND